MHRIRPLARRMPLFLLVPLAALGGCGKKIWVTQYPEFHTPELGSIVVAPFHNATAQPDAGRILTDKVANAMVANGTYDIYTPGDLRGLIGRAALPAPDQVDELAGLLRPGGKVQAILTGTVTTFAGTQQRTWKRRAIHARDHKGRVDKDRIDRYEDYEHVHNEAAVDATARLVGVADGKVLHATRPGLAGVKVVAETPADGLGVPRMDLAECLAAASDQCVAKLTEEFAVVRKQVRVGRDALTTASGLDGEEWEREKRFERTDPQMFVVLKLPPECDRNRFRIALVRDQTRQEIATVEVTWLRRWSDKQGKAFAFSPAEIAAAGGPGDYQAVLYCGGAAEPVLDTGFEIKED